MTIEGPEASEGEAEQGETEQPGGLEAIKAIYTKRTEVESSEGSAEETIGKITKAYGEVQEPQPRLNYYELTIFEIDPGVIPQVLDQFGVKLSDRPIGTIPDTKADMLNDPQPGCSVLSVDTDRDGHSGVMFHLSKSGKGDRVTAVIVHPRTMAKICSLVGDGDLRPEFVKEINRAVVRVLFGGEGEKQGIRK